MMSKQSEKPVQTGKAAPAGKEKLTDKITRFRVLKLIDWFVPTPKCRYMAAVGRKLPVSSYTDLENNSVYRKQTLYFSVLMLLVWVFNILGIVAYFKFKEPPPPSLYQVTPAQIKAGQLYENRLLLWNHPRYTEKALTNWLRKAVGEIYTFDFTNYDQRIKELRPLFTERGYELFVNGLKMRKMGEVVKSKHYILSSYMAGAELFPDKFSEFNAKTDSRYYQVNVPVLITVTGKGRTVVEKTDWNIMVALLVDNEGKSGYFIDDIDMVSK